MYVWSVIFFSKERAVIKFSNSSCGSVYIFSTPISLIYLASVLLRKLLLISVMRYIVFPFNPMFPFSFTFPRIWNIPSKLFAFIMIVLLCLISSSAQFILFVNSSSENVFLSSRMIGLKNI